MTRDDRLYGLDATRGLAALAVVVFHYQHLYWLGMRPAPFDPHGLPLYSVLAPIYNHGPVAVNLFFCLSGFVFFWLYEEAIRERKIGGPWFGWLRFSRLYPLHLATLIAVALLQPLFVRETGQPFTYALNDGPHFILNLFFLQGLALDKGYSFNGPTWSVSIEAILYVLFFAVSRLRLAKGIAGSVALTVVGLALWQAGFWSIGQGIAGFFLGGLTYRAYGAIVTGPRPRSTTFAVMLGAAACWIAALVQAFAHLVRVDPGLANMVVVVVALPPTILALALSERVLGARFHKAAWLGDLSYAAYLIHFPMLLVAAIAVTMGWIGPWRVTGLPGLAFFVLMVIAISLAVHHGFERPAQAWLRKHAPTSWRIPGTPETPPAG